MPELRTIPGVELARTGTFNLSTGPATFNRSHFASAVEHARNASQAPRIHIGHTDGRFAASRGDGDPVFGSVRNLRTAEDGDTLLGDLETPAWLADAMPTSYPQRSIEAAIQGDTMRLTGLAVLGATAPGIDSLSDLQHLVAASGHAERYVFASGEIADGETVSVALPAPSSAAPAAPTQPPPAAPTKEDAVDLSALRTTLGLPDDASQDAIDAALAELKARPTPDAVAEQVAAAKAPAGTVAIDQATWDQVKAAAEDGRAARADQVKREDETFVVAAAAKGKIPAARTGHYVTLMQGDRDGTRAFLDALDENVVPVTASGSTADVLEGAGDITEAEYQALFNTEAKA